MAGRNGPLGVAFDLVFAVPFVAVGVVMARAGLGQAVAGQGMGYALLAFGVLFAGAGVRQAVGALRSRQSAEARARAAQRKPDEQRKEGEMPVVGVARASGYRVAADSAATARRVYGEALDSAPLPQLPVRPGRVLEYDLGLEQKSLRGELVFALLWNALVLPMFFASIAQGASGAGMFMLLFVAVGAFVGFRVVKRLLARAKIARVEIDAEPAFLGMPLKIHVEQGGPARISLFQVTLVCREEVTYTVGTDTRTENWDVLELPLLEDAFQVGLGQRWSHDLAVDLPAHAPSSFAGKHNVVAWLVRVRAQIEGWPDYDESFAFRALPRPPS